MEQLRAELSHLLGEKLSRIECVNEKADTALWALYDSQGNPMPLMARSFSTPGKARQLAWKTTMLARSGTVRMPTIYGVMTHEEHPGPDVLLLERMRGVSVEAPARTPERWEQLKDQIVEALLAWHRQDSRGCVGAVDNTQENFWPSWYRNMLKCYGPRSISSITPVYRCRISGSCFALANVSRHYLKALTTIVY